MGGVRIGALTWIMGLFFAVLGASAQSTFVEPARIDGTFVQLLQVHRQWTPLQWDQLFEGFEKLHISRVVVQWAVCDDIKFFSTDQQDSALENILKHADKAGIQVTVGLVNDFSYWENIQKEEKVSAYLQALQGRSIAVAAQMTPLLMTHASFVGWYFPQEIDDINWRKPSLEMALFGYLKEVSTELKHLTPNKQIVISGFVNTGTDPLYLKGLWGRLLDKAPNIDSVLFQDGIGAKKLKITEISTYFNVVQSAANTRGRSFQPIVEIFRQTSAENAPFKAVPASFESVIEQLKVAVAYAPSVIVFSIPEYMMPEGSDASKALVSRYLQRITH